MARRIDVIGVRSPLAGLNRRQLAFAEVLAQSVSAVAPSAAAVTLPVLVIAWTGAAALPVFIGAGLLVLMVAYCVTQFARRMTSAGGVYSYTAKGLGPRAAYTVGWSLLIGYGGAAMTSALGGGIYLASLLDTATPLSFTSGLVAACAVGIAGVAGLLMVRGIRLSARVSLTLEVVSVAFVIAVLALLVGSTPDTPPHQVGGPASFDSVSAALLLAVMSFVGFESATTLGVETRRPFLTVPRALVWTPVVLVALYVAVTAAQVWIFAREPVGLLDSPIPLADLTEDRHRSALAVLLDVGILSSWIACLMGSANALVRVLFTMGREGVLPTRLGRTHPAYGTPWVAIAVTVPVVTGLPLLALASQRSLVDALVSFLTLSAYGYLLSYALVCIATPVFLRRLGELTPPPAVVGVAAFATTVFLVGWNLATRSLDDGGVALAFVGLMLVGWTRLLVLGRRDPGCMDRIGAYDEPVLDDLFEPDSTWERP